ncbi:hypothetical protein [Bermanella sp. R86510]|uniref:phosphoribosyltransferase-like protein n=1 Tax=unclassified Bermanella TaxID=2627862 RepID=UPI0037CA8811
MQQWNVYKERVLDRIQLCCEKKIWPFEYTDFQCWLRNFNDDKQDEIVALYLLDRLVVRTKETAISGYSRLIASELRQSWIRNGIISNDLSITDLMKALKSRHGLNKVAMAPVTDHTEYGDSGPSLFRHLDPIYSTKKKISKDVQAIVYIDDILGTGTQLMHFLENISPQEEFPDAKIYYAPLVAYEDKLEESKERYPDIQILPVEIINDEVMPFKQNEYTEIITNFLDISVAELWQHYLKMFDKYCGAKGYKDMWKGYGNLGLPVVFEWGCPNNVPGMLRMEESNLYPNWSQLFRGRS